MANILILGDVHLGKSLNIGKPGIDGQPNSRIADQLKLLDWTIEQATKKNTDHLIITGDIYEDERPHPALIAYFMQWLSKIPHSIHVHIVMGNHDIIRSGKYVLSALDIIQEKIFQLSPKLPSISIYRNFQTIKLDDAYITFAPFRDRRMLETNSVSDALKIVNKNISEQHKSIPKNYKKILIGHLAIENSMYVGDELDDIANEILCPLDIFKGYDSVWMGHIHRPQIMSKSPLIAHTGSMDISDFGETDHTKSIVFFNTKDPIKYELIDLPTRPLRRIIVEIPKGKDPTENLKNHINEQHKKQSFKDAIVKIQVKLFGKEMPNINRDQIEELLNELDVFHLVKLSEHRSIVVVNKEKNIVDDNMKAASAIKAYSEIMDWDKEEKSLFLEFSNKIIKETNE